MLIFYRCGFTIFVKVQIKDYKECQYMPILRMLLQMLRGKCSPPTSKTKKITFSIVLTIYSRYMLTLTSSNSSNFTLGKMLFKPLSKQQDLKDQQEITIQVYRFHWTSYILLLVTFSYLFLVNI